MDKVKINSKLFLFATISLIAISYSADAFAESETIFSEDTIITDTTMVSGETWTVQSGVTLTMERDVNLVFDMGSVLNNEGTIKAKHGMGGIYFDGDSILNNYGLIENPVAFTVRMEATVNNDGTISVDNNNNQGVIIKGTFNNGKTGILGNQHAGEFYISGVFNNDGHIVNKGDFIIQEGGTLNNEGTINDDGRMMIFGVFNNNGSFNDVEIPTVRPVASLEWINDDVLSFADTGIIRVHDEYNNKNSGIIETLDVSIYVDQRREDALAIELSETAKDTGIFEGTIFFSNTAPSQGHRLHVINYDVIVAEYSYATDPESELFFTTVMDEITIMDLDDTLSLKSQVSGGLNPEEISCTNPNHVLVERTNEKLACVEFTTAEKLGWMLI